MSLRRRGGGGADSAPVLGSGRPALSDVTNSGAPAAALAMKPRQFNSDDVSAHAVTTTTQRHALVMGGETFFEVPSVSAPQQASVAQRQSSASSWSLTSMLESLLPAEPVQALGAVHEEIGRVAANLVDGAGLTSALVHTAWALTGDTPALAMTPSPANHTSGDVRSRRSSSGAGTSSSFPMPSMVPVQPVAFSSAWDVWDPMPTPTATQRQHAKRMENTVPVAATQPLRVTRLRPAGAAAASPAAPVESPSVRDSELAEQMQQQLQLLLAEKARLAQENARLSRENANLQELMAFMSQGDAHDSAETEEEEEDEDDDAAAPHA